MKPFTRYHVGDIRPSQLLWTHGVGAIVDLPHLSAIVMGLDEWDVSKTQEIKEERLLSAVQSALGRQVTALRRPPVEELDSPYSTVGVPVATFPRWLVCPYCHLLAPVESGLFELKADSRSPDKAQYRHGNCPKARTPTAFPARFMIACEAGHLDDFPWQHYVHGGRPCPKSVLRLKENGFSGEITDIYVQCDVCHTRQSMALAFNRSDEERSYRPTCTGRSPHLRSYTGNGCAEETHAILLSASNAWFPLVYNSLALPRVIDPLDVLVEKHWNTLQVVQDLSQVQLFLGMPHLQADFGGSTPEAIWQAIERQRASTPVPVTIQPGELKLPEWEILSHPQRAPRTDDFQVSLTETPGEYAEIIEQVVLVERLREVRALTGFTRIESLGDYTEEEELPKNHIMRLARRAPQWVPAAEVRGEGIFLQLREEAIQRWLQQTVIGKHNETFKIAHRRWRQARNLDDPEANYPGLRYVLLHTFAHALMRQLALNCGYAAASIRERIYAQDAEKEGGAMAGILIYTADSDSEGTLGGLVNQGRDLGYHIAGALEAMQYCASDPLCSEHALRDDLTLHGAACHACLFAPETSCERGNRYLDRSVLIETVERGDLAFFREIIG